MFDLYRVPQMVCSLRLNRVFTQLPCLRQFGSMTCQESAAVQCATGTAAVAIAFGSNMVRTLYLFGSKGSLTSLLCLNAFGLQGDSVGNIQAAIRQLSAHNIQVCFALTLHKCFWNETKICLVTTWGMQQSLTWCMLHRWFATHACMRVHQHM